MMVAVVTVCPAFYLAVSEAKTEILYFWIDGMLDTTVTSSVKEACQVYEQNYKFIYLGSTNDYPDLSIEVDVRTSNA